MGVGRGLSEKGFDSLRFFLSMCICVRMRGEWAY